MDLKNKCQIEWNHFSFHPSLLVTMAFLFLFVSCDPASGSDSKKDKELRIQVKPVMLIENESISKTDIVDMVNRSTIRRGGYVAIIPTSLGVEDGKVIDLRNLLYNQQIEAVHILNLNLQSPIKNTDLLTIENATILCLLGGDIEKFVQMAAYSDLKSTILNAHKKGTLVVINGKACSLAGENYFNFNEEALLRTID